MNVDESVIIALMMPEQVVTIVADTALAMLAFTFCAMPDARFMMTHAVQAMAERMIRDNE